MSTSWSHLYCKSRGCEETYQGTWKPKEFDVAACIQVNLFSVGDVCSHPLLGIW